MKKFRIYYNGGTLTCFNKVEEFEDYETAVIIIKDKNKYSVKYPNLVQITEV